MVLEFQKRNSDSHHKAKLSRSWCEDRKGNKFILNFKTRTKFVQLLLISNYIYIGNSFSWYIQNQNVACGRTTNLLFFWVSNACNSWYIQHPKWKTNQNLLTADSAQYLPPPSLFPTHSPWLSSPSKEYHIVSIYCVFFFSPLCCPSWPQVTHNVPNKTFWAPNFPARLSSSI